MGLFDKFSNKNQQQASGAAVTSDTPPVPSTEPVTVKTAQTNVRLGFLRKVYGLLTINFLITIGISLVFGYIEPVRDFVTSNVWVLYAGLGVTVVSFLVLACIRLKFPVNLIVMYVFVIAFSVVIGFIVARYINAGAGRIVLQAFVATAAVFLVITAYVAITKKDFSFLYGFLAAGIVVLLVLFLITWLLAFTGTTNKWLIFAISCFGYVEIRRKQLLI